MYDLRNTIHEGGIEMKIRRNIKWKYATGDLFVVTAFVLLGIVSIIKLGRILYFTYFTMLALFAFTLFQHRFIMNPLTEDIGFTKGIIFQMKEIEKYSL